MEGIPKYTAEENIIRIMMEKSVNFVVVEGVNDTPIYESVIETILPDDDIGFWDVVHLGGKNNIKELINECVNENFICVTDKDFDLTIHSDKVVNLTRYSIENFFICEDAISTSLAIALKAKKRDIVELFNLDGFFDEVDSAARRLLYALFFYQRKISPDPSKVRVAWGNSSIHKNPPEWGLCENRINQLIQSLLPNGVSELDAKAYFEDNFQSSGVTAYDLPGKMLRVLLQIYISKFYKVYKKKGGIQFNTVDSCMESIVACLNHSKAFVEQIQPVLKFLRTV